MQHTRFAMTNQATRVPARSASAGDAENRENALSAAEQVRLELLRRGIEPIE
jgi:hypothetical protein